jgi:hypothetical protein
MDSKTNSIYNFGNEIPEHPTKSSPHICHLTY